MLPRSRLAAVVGASLLLASCSGAERGADERPLVVASVYPLAFAAERVAGDRAIVEDLTPPGVEPHDLELSPSQVGLLHRADLVLYLGHGFQPAVEDVAARLGATAVDVLEAVPPDLASPSDEHGDATDEHVEPEADPHVWLDPRRMQDIVRLVGALLGEAEPAGGAAFERNAAELVEELHGLDAEMEVGLRRCESRDLVVAHEAFGYLAERYDLEQVGIAGLDPEAEPSPQRLAEAIRFAQENEVRTIFFERLVSPAVAETVAREVGAGTAVLDPLESAPEDGNYLDAMQMNLRALREGLDCA